MRRHLQRIADALITRVIGLLDAAASWYYRRRHSPHPDDPR